MGNSPNIFWALSPSNLCGQCSSCGSSGQRKQSVNTRRRTKLKCWRLMWGLIQCGIKRRGVFLPVEIWLWLQPPSFSHETRGSQTLHLWVWTAQTGQAGHKHKKLYSLLIWLYSAHIYNQFQSHCSVIINEGVNFNFIVLKGAFVE